MCNPEWASGLCALCHGSGRTRTYIRTQEIEDEIAEALADNDVEAAAEAGACMRCRGTGKCTTCGGSGSLCDEALDDMLLTPYGK